MKLPHVTEGRAYHRGDTIVLRVPMRNRADFEKLRASLDAFEAKAGVHVLLVDFSVEVVEPVEATT